MDCRFTEKISLLIDQELADNEIESVREHLKTCAVCKDTEKAFLKVRSEIRANDFTPWPFNTERGLRKILNSQRVSLWRRRIPVPVPAMVALLIALFALSMWLTSSRSKDPVVGSVKLKPSTIEAPQSKQDGLDLSRFDHGERAAIIKIKREQATSVKR